jgi:hypothetical protein
MSSSADESPSLSFAAKPLPTMYEQHLELSQRERIHISRTFMPVPLRTSPNSSFSRPSVDVMDPAPATPPPSSPSVVAATTAPSAFLFEEHERLTLLSLWKVPHITAWIHYIAHNL